MVELGSDSEKPLAHHCLPMLCSTCGCLPKDLPCRDTCVDVPGGGLRLTCPAAP
jgi:hypothetical protein